MKRRDFLTGIVGFGIGGALATTTGLGYYYIRRARRAAQPQLVTRRASEAGLDDWVLTSSDHSALQSLNGFDGQSTLEILDDVDIVGGGDFAASRVAGVDDCVAACEAEEQCNAFTFARMSHPITEKRHMCWLKADKAPANVVGDVFYVSGRRK